MVKDNGCFQNAGAMTAAFILYILLHSIRVDLLGHIDAERGQRCVEFGIGIPDFADDLSDRFHVYNSS